MLWLEDAERAAIPTCPESGARQRAFLKFLILKELLLKSFNRLREADNVPTEFLLFSGTSLCRLSSVHVLMFCQFLRDER